MIDLLITFTLFTWSVCSLFRFVEDYPWREYGGRAEGGKNG